HGDALARAVEHLARGDRLVIRAETARRNSREPLGRRAGGVALDTLPAYSRQVQTAQQMRLPPMRAGAARHLADRDRAPMRARAGAIAEPEPLALVRPPALPARPDH